MTLGENCSSSCRTKDHSTWGECVRSKNLRTNALEPELLSRQRKADKQLDAYAAARKTGIQPKTTSPADVQRAVRASDQTGQAFKA